MHDVCMIIRDGVLGSVRVHDSLVGSLGSHLAREQMVDNTDVLIEGSDL